jgi:hypothetical protein
MGGWVGKRSSVGGWGMRFKPSQNYSHRFVILPQPVTGPIHNDELLRLAGTSI